MEHQERIYLSIKNFKCLENVKDLELKPITLLFGPNGSGKSSLFQAIKFLSHNLFSIYVESIGGEPDSEKLYYKLDELSNLISYDQIVTDNDREKKISYLIKFNNVKIEYEEVYKILENLEKRMTISDEVAKYLTTEKELERLKQQRDRLDNFDLISLDSEESYAEPIFKLKNEITDFSVLVEFSVFNNSDKPWIHISIINEVDGSTYHYAPQSLLEEYHYSYFKEVHYKNKLKENLLNQALKFTRIIPFVEGIQENYEEKQSSRQKALNEFYNDINIEIRNYNDNNDWSKLSDSTKKDLIFDLFKFYIKTFILHPQIVEKYLKAYIHLPSVRKKPKQIYPKYEGRFKSEDYYGLMREFDPTDNQGGFYVPIKFDETTGWFTIIENTHGIPIASIPEFINYFLRKMKLADSIKIEQDKYSGFLTFKTYNGDAVINLAQASSGLLQVLPIISISFHSRRKDLAYKKLLRMIEQPELHLHPKLQCDLAEFFCHKVLAERNFIIETHSEHLLRKIQVLIAKSDKSLGHEDLKNRVVVYYFNKDEMTGKTSIKEMELEDNGFFKEPWPDGFFDDSYNLTKELLRANKN